MPELDKDKLTLEDIRFIFEEALEEYESYKELEELSFNGPCNED